MQKIYTQAGKELSGIPWQRYPRPQMVRKDWLCLNGEWGLSILKGHDCAAQETVLVPFCPESLLSGVTSAPTPGDKLVYHRSFSLPESWRGKRILLHFGAVMQEVSVCVNRRELCRHENGYLPFSAEITDALVPEENTLTVTVTNDLSHKHPWGKQKEKRGGMWYTPCSGIWQTVWLEPVPESYIHGLRIDSGADWVEIAAEGVSDGTVTFQGQDYPLNGGKARITVASPMYWSPERPHLYSFTIRAGEDQVSSYFALRTLSVKRFGGVSRLCLNGKPYFFHGLLDQGYWSDGLYTPADPESYERDILAVKKLGFNTLRKHIKIEPEQFYYDCDRLGIIVFQDMVNCGKYSFLHDTGLPTLGLIRLSDQNRNIDTETQKNFLKAMEETVLLLRNHPSICLWTIFNEGWGQFCADDAYDRLKTLDSSRFIDSTSGWFHQTKSDVDSLHIYFKKLRLGKQDLPQLLSEFGGYCLKLPEHSFNMEKTYGYRICKTRNDYVRDLRALYEKELLPLVEKGLCGAIYTQVSDVEDETNGLLTYDRAVKKLRPEEFADLAPRLQRAVE